LAIIIAALLISMISLWFFIVPYAWICFVWCIAFLYAFKNTKNSKVKVICFNVSVVLILFGILEMYLHSQDEDIRQIIKRRNTLREERRNEEGVLLKRGTLYYHNNDILGYGPMKNQTISWKRYSGNDLIFDVSYTIDSNGLRVSPPYREGANGCIVFFGCSYTFGDGVNDNETMPYLVGPKTDGKFRVYNFGYRGYGPHQMLASIEHGLVADIIECEPEYVIYTAIIEQAFRSAGRAVWDWHGPKYSINGNGEVVYLGHFDDEKFSESYITKKIKNQLKKSNLITRLFFKIINKNDIRLMVGIIDASKRALTTNYPRCEFHVILWNKPKIRIVEELISGLKGKGIRVHLVSDILSDYYDKMSKYQISQIDDHPNQLAYEIIAEYISRRIIGK